MGNLIVDIYTPQELNHSSYIHTGLFELEKEGFLQTRVKLSIAPRLGTIRVQQNSVMETKQPHPKTSFYTLSDINTGRKIRFATDLYDASDSFSKYALEHCDFVFKRNFESSMIHRLPIRYQNKLYPLGLSFRVYPNLFKPSFKLYLGIVLTNLIMAMKPDRNFFKRIKNSWILQNNHWKQREEISSLSVFDKFESASSDSILFQTRCFPHEEHDDAKAIHFQRYQLILHLRKKYPGQFTGGIIPSPLALKNYKEALSDLPSVPLKYLEMVKKAKMVIYTRGLANSPAWKMPEYLSQAKVIIAEHLTTELPAPLIHGIHLLYFQNIEELDKRIEEVQSDETLAMNLSKNARIYFEENVHPARNMKRIIEFMLAK